MHHSMIVQQKIKRLFNGVFCTCLKDEHKVADAPLVEIGLTVWPKIGGLKPPPPPSFDGPEMSWVCCHFSSKNFGRIPEPSDFNSRNSLRIRTFHK